MKKYKPKKVIHDKNTDTVMIQWQELGDKHIGWSEELNFGGVTIVLDRNKAGKVCAVEIL